MSYPTTESTEFTEKTIYILCVLRELGGEIGGKHDF
jgi:hypothetical protein